MEYQDGMQAAQPSWRFRIWRKLGFRYSYVTPPDDEACQYVIHRFVTHWDWKDRLRILFSGKSEVTALFMFECKLLYHSKIKTDTGVLPPGGTKETW